MPSLRYSAPSWLPGGHLQTLYPYFFAPRPAITYQRERLELADGDFLDLDWTLPEQPAPTPTLSPLVALFHGLEGNAQAFYARNLMQAVTQAGWCGIVVHFRGCSGVPNRLPRAYFAGDSAEIGRVLHYLRTRHDGPLFAVGYSLGGNALLRFLGEQDIHAQTIINAAVTVSAPFRLAVAGTTLDTGISRFIYTRHFLHTLKQKAQEKCQRFPHLFDQNALSKARTLWAFDQYYTAPAHGFSSADDYWQHAASMPVLPNISIPTLLINARNDPFYPAHALPTAEQVSATTLREFYAEGGHVGFPAGRFPAHARWLPERILDFLRHHA